MPARLLLIVALTAAAYADAEQQRFITKLKSKIDEGLALAGRSPELARN